MAEVEKTPLGDAVKEIVNLKKLKGILDLMMSDDASDEKKEKALMLVPAILNAMSRFDAKSPLKAMPATPPADELEAV